MDYKVEIEKLREQIRKLEKEQEEAETKIMLEKHGLKIDDIVEFEWDEDDEDVWYPIVWCTGKVVGYWNNRVKVRRVDDRIEFVDIKEVKLYDKNDYTLRHKIWDRPLEPGDKIKILVERKNLILGGIYEVDSIFRHKNKPQKCFILHENSSGLGTYIHANEYHITHE